MNRSTDTVDEKKTDKLDHLDGRDGWLGSIALTIGFMALRHVTFQACKIKDLATAPEMRDIGRAVKIDSFPVVDKKKTKNIFKWYVINQWIFFV